MSKLIIPDEVKQAIINDKQNMTYGQLQKKYGFGSTVMKAFCSKPANRSVIPSDLRPREFASDIFNWDFECF